VQTPDFGRKNQTKQGQTHSPAMPDIHETQRETHFHTCAHYTEVILPGKMPLVKSNCTKMWESLLFESANSAKPPRRYRNMAEKFW
jgi:hypothetical protein